MARPVLVVDASVVVKWVLPEEGHEQAARIQELYAEDRVDLLAPHLLIAETHNVLWKRARRRELTTGQARQCAEYLAITCPLLIHSDALARSALELAIAHHRPVYDCLYLALALECQCDLITADERFFAVMRAAFPCMQLLTHWSPR